LLDKDQKTEPIRPCTHKLGGVTHRYWSPVASEGMIVTTEATITELPKKEAPALPAGGGMDY
jgi:hypothetical protein